MTLLTDPGTASTWSADMTIGAELLAASATVSMANSLFDLADPTSSSDAQVEIHQISGVLHLMLSLANTGANLVTTTVGVASAAGTAGGGAGRGRGNLEQPGERVSHSCTPGMRTPRIVRSPPCVR